MARQRTADCFDNIHKMLRNHQNQEVLQMVLDQTGEKILAPYDEDLNHAWYTVGTIYFKRAEYSKAIMAFKRALADWGQDIDAHLALANAYSIVGDPGAARDILLKAYGISPGEARITYNLGNVFFDLGDLDKAEFFYRSVLNRADNQVRQLALSNLEKIGQLKKIPED